MRLAEKKAMFLVITEHIEMKLFSSEEQCVTITTQEIREQDKYKQRFRCMEHPLASDSEEDEELLVQNQTKQQNESKRKPPVQEEPCYCPHITNIMDDIDIEMELFPPIRLSDIELVEIKSTDSSIISPPSSNKTSHVKWKRLVPQKLGLVVKDVVCLPRELYMAQLEGQITPRYKRQSGLELMARITIDCSWSAVQMENRLALLFQRWFVKKVGQKFSFTYLQNVQGSRVMFVPDTPEEGWTGEQVLGICEHGALYILSHHSQLQGESSGSEAPVLKRKDFNSNVRKKNESQQVRRIPPHICKSPEKLTLNLDTILRLFRVDNTEDVEIHIKVKREDVFCCALKEMRKPDFCFRSTPVISFNEEEDLFTENSLGGPQEPLKEFFRLSLLELQQSCVFEGHPGPLFFTYDLTALEDRKYYEAGVLIGWSLTHGGPEPCFLHPALYQLMCCQSPSLENFNWRNIVDTEARTRLQELNSCVDVNQLSPSLFDWVSHCGFPGIHSVSPNEIPTIYGLLVKHYIYHRVASMISQFSEGLNSCGGLWDLIKSHWEMFLPVMTSKDQRPLKLEEFKQLFTFCYSHPDSELRAEEEATVTHWETVLEFVNDGRTNFSFEDLLIFITGVDHLPPFGFPSQISLHFYSQDTSSSERKLPHAVVDSLEFFLPRGVEETVDLLVLLNRSLQKALDLKTDG